MTPVYRAWIGLGCNLASPAGGRAATLRSAVRALKETGKVAAVSSFWQTAPVGMAEQPEFLNAVAALETALPPPELLQLLLQIEREHGRDRSSGVANGPRTLDLDLLLMEQVGAPLLLATPQLTLPHPRLHLRRFVLAPLAEIAPQLRHPGLKKSIAEILEELEPSGANAPKNVRRFCE